MFFLKSHRAKSLAHRYVDMWAFMGVHPSNLEIFQRLKMADDRQFGTNMDVCGTVSERDVVADTWQKTHIVGIRTDAWNPDADQQERRLAAIKNDRQDFLKKRIKSSGALSSSQMTRLQKQILRDPVMKMQPRDLESRRLVMKLFRNTGERIRWTGTIEEVTTREVHNSLGARKSVLSFAGLTNGSRYMTALQENNRTFRIPSIFTFCYLDERNNRLWYINIKRKWVSVGADFIIEAEGRKIGEIDGALIGFGYNAHVYIYDPELAKDAQFFDLITMFATTVGYQRAMRRAVRRRVKATRQGMTGQHVVEDEEIRLLRNPRAAA